MQIVTPTTLDQIVWQGNLEPDAKELQPKTPARPAAALGQVEIWPASALEQAFGKPWNPPLGNADFWLIRVACTLRNPGGMETITNAELVLDLRPINFQAAAEATYAFSLLPDLVTVDNPAEFEARLNPELTFGKDMSVKLGQVGVTITFRNVFPIIQAYDVGTPTPSWRFRAHANRPLDGDQFCYAVIAAHPGADGIFGEVALFATLDTQFGPLRFGTPREASAATRFIARRG